MTYNCQQSKIMYFYIDFFMQNSVFMDCGCVMENHNNYICQHYRVHPNDMSLVGRSVVLEFCNRIELCSLVAVMLTIIIGV